LKQTERWYVSTSKTAYDDGFLIGQWNNSTYNANSVVTIERKLTMPPLPVGTYYLFHEVDALKEHAEERESDNVSREALQIKVIFC
jgi:ribosomal protein S15P/S13E